MTLLLQGRVEYLLLHYATRALYGQLLSAGIEIQEYHQSFLHAKVAVIDDHWATVGSSNIDPYSLLMAREANVVVRDPDFCGPAARRARAKMIDEGARRVGPQHWALRPRAVQGARLDRLRRRPPRDGSAGLRRQRMVSRRPAQPRAGAAVRGAAIAASIGVGDLLIASKSRSPAGVCSRAACATRRCVAIVIAAAAAARPEAATGA